MGYDYDLLLSYKTERSNEVRTVAEILIASGLRVWFAEYSLGMDIYCEDEVEERQRLQDALTAGIARSRHALLFTSDPYCKSAWCRKEMFLLFREAMDGKRQWGSLAEVQFPPGEILGRKRALADRFARIQSRKLRSSGPQSVREVIEFLDSLKWFAPIGAAKVEEALGRAHGASCKLRYGFVLHMPEFSEEETEFVFRPTHQRIFQGEFYQWSAKLGDCAVQAICTINPSRTSLGDLSLSASTEIDDIALRRRYIRFARTMVPEAAESSRCHLVFAQNHSHLGVTWRRPESHQGYRTWERHYAMVTRNTMTCPGCGSSDMTLLSVEGGDARVQCQNRNCQRSFLAPRLSLDPNGELHLVFGIRVRAGAPDDEFRTLASLLPHLDAVATSMRQERAYGWERTRSAIMGIALGYAVSTIADYLDVRYGRGWAPAICAAAAGLAAMEGVASVVVPAQLFRVLRNAHHYARKFPLRLVPFPTYGRMLDRWHGVGVGVLVSSFCHLAVLPLSACVIWGVAAVSPVGESLWVSGVIGAVISLLCIVVTGHMGEGS